MTASFLIGVVGIIVAMTLFTWIAGIKKLAEDKLSK